MDIKDILEVDVNSLAKLQHDTLKRHVLDVLSNISILVSNSQYTDVHSYLFYSPAGDGYGLENHCINFGYSEKELDIAEVLTKLDQLKQKSS